MREWILETDSGAPIYRLTGTSIDMYIQPGGCLEFGQTDDPTGERDLVHFCPENFSAIQTAIEMARTKAVEIDG